MPALIESAFFVLQDDFPLFAGRCAIHAGLVLAGALVVIWLLRRTSASFRFSILAIAQIIAIAIPLVWLTCPRIPVLPAGFVITDDFSSLERGRNSIPFGLHAPEKPSRTINHDGAMDSTGVKQELPRSSIGGQSVARTEPNRDEVASGVAASVYQPKANEPSKFTATFVLMVIWGLGSFVLLLRLCASARRLALLARLSIVPLPSTVKRAFDDSLATMAPGRRCRLLISSQAKMPMAWGILRPIVLLPQNVAEGNEETLHSVLGHELAHIRRRDPLTRLIGQLCAAVYWFNPLAWLVLHRAAVLAEHASDDRVLQKGIAPTDYAEHLLWVVRAGCSVSRNSLALGMSKPSHLGKRVAAVLDDSTNRRLTRRWEIAALASIGLVFVLPIAAVSQSPTDPADQITTVPRKSEERNSNTTPASTTAIDRVAGNQFQPATPIAWEKRRVAGQSFIRGRVVDAQNRPVPNVDVGQHWSAFHGDLSPTSLVMTDSRGEFELPGSSNMIMAMDRTRTNGGFALFSNKRDSNSATEKNQDEPVAADPIKIEITQTPLVDVRGSYLTSEVNRRPQTVWTIVERLPEEIGVIEQRDDSPFFSFRLPPGKYRLRGTAADFEDVYREFEVDPSAGPVEFPDLPLPINKLALLYGQPAPELHLTGGQGISPTTKLSDYRGKWVVIEFWGTWCGPCLMQMDQLFRFSEAHAKDRDRFEIMTVHQELPDGKSNLETDLPKLLKRWERDEFPYPIVIDTTNRIIEAYGVKGYPTTVIIDPEGRVAQVPGVWGLSEILKGRVEKPRELFQTEGLDKSRSPDVIQPSNLDGGIIGQRCVAFNGHRDMVAAAEFLPVGKQFVTAASDNTLRFWDVETHAQTRLIQTIPRPGTIQSYGSIHLFVAQGGNLIGGYFCEKRAGKYVHFPRLWRADTDFEQFISLSDPEAHFSKAAVSPDGHRLAAHIYLPATKASVLRIYDLSNGTILYELDIHRERRSDSSSGSAIRFSPDGRYLAVSGTVGHSVQMWDVDQARMLWEETPADVYGINSFSFSPDGQTLTYAGWNESLEFRATMTGELLRTLRAPGHRPVFAAISLTGRYVATAGNNPQPRIKIWDNQSGKVVGTLVGHPTGIGAESLAWSPDDRYLVSVAGGQTNQPGEVLLWDLQENGIIPSE